MSLSLLTFGLLCARSAQAQTPGHWEFDHYGCQGVDTGSGGRFTGGPWSFPWASTQTVNLTGIAYGEADWSNITVTLTPFFRWVPGSNPSAPPSILYAKITSEAYAGDEYGGSVSADNGFGDVSNQPPPGYYSIGASSVGSHLEHKDPQGQTLVSLPPQTLSVSGGRANDWQSISTEVSYQVETDNKNRAVTISSPTIEDSYQKTNNPETFGRDIHLRDLDTGAMTVESVVTTSGGEFVVSPSVIGDAFTANTPNFHHPYYTWSIPTAGGRVGQYTQQYLGVESDQYVTIPVNIYFGQDKTIFPLKSVLKVDVRDDDNVTGSNIYNVIWHLPVENWNQVSSVPTTNRMYPDSGTDPDGNTSIEPNRTVDYSIPTPEIDVTGPAVKTVSVFLGGAGAAAPMLLPESIASGPVGIATVTLLAAGSVFTGFLVPPDPGHDYGHTNYVDYEFAVKQQQIINNGGTGIQRFNPTLVDQALAEMARLQAKYGAGWESYWNEDHYFSQSFGSMRVTAQAGRYRQLNTYTGDAYDQHGYAGQTTDPLIRDLDPFYGETWNYSGG